MASEQLPPPGPAPRPLLLTAGPAVLLARAMLAVLGLVLVAGVVGAVLLYLTQARITQKERELASNAAVSATALDDLAAANEPLMRFAAGDCTPINQLIKGLTPDQREHIPNVTALLNSLQLGCAPANSNYGPVFQFWEAYEPGVVARLKSQPDIAAPLYAKAAAVPQIQDALKVRALEGLAYSQLKLKNLAAAAATDSQAAALGADYVYTDITGLKIACAQHAAPGAVLARYNTAVSQRRARIAAASQDADLKRIADDDLHLLTTDPELRAMCHYAGLPRAG